MGLKDKINDRRMRGPGGTRPIKLKKRPPREYDEGRSKKAAIVICIVAVAFLVFFALINFLTDWLWFKDLGFSSVFFKKIVTQLEIGIPVFAVVALLTRVYLISLRNGYFNKIESHEIPDLKKLKIISWTMSAIFAFAIATFSASKMWMNLLQFKNATKFHLKDPLFHLDISFYIFKLDFLNQLNTLVIGAVIGVVIITLIYYLVLLTIRTPDIFEDDDMSKGFSDEGEPIINKKLIERIDFDGRGGAELNRDNLSKLLEIASVKLSILGAVFYLMVAVDFLLRQFELLHSHTGTVYGAGYTDVNVKLWVYRLIMVLSCVGAVTLVMHFRKREMKELLRIPIAILAVGIAGSIIGFAVQGLAVSPDEINKESKYLKENIKYTQHAYGLDNVVTKAFPADNTLTADDLADNVQTLENIRINDYEPVKDFYNQTQSIRQYYDFNDVDIDRYNIGGKETQTFLSPREINEDKISSTWLNRHLKYTHGYGVTLSRVDEVTDSGQPNVLIKNIPPESSVKDIEIKRPEIYFGELSNEYVVVDTKEQEFDYPDGNANKYTSYGGKTGIKLTPFKRLLFAFREGSIKLLVSSNVTSDSRIIINRNVIDRVKLIMPYLHYEEDPYMTTVDGRLYWIIDAYTESNNYPYSEPYSDEVNTTNYIRNSVKVVVDAYNGNVTYYVVDGNDPIAKTYQKIYPKLFKSFKQMPEGIKAHIRYPNHMFNIQANVYAKYHMNEVKVFYQDEDRWDIANQIYGTKQKKMEPSYYILKLPGESNAEFINMIPYTPKSKQNMTAIMMARNDGDRYGELLLYKFPKSKTIYGPMQVEAQIDQNTEISKEFSLWNSSGSRYRRGDLFVIPINDSIMYVEPVYLEASKQAIPEVKRVIVVYGDKISYKATLGDALESMFGEGYDSTFGKNASQSNEGSSVKELIALANSEYDAAIAAQRSGDWKGYGEHIDKMSSYLRKLQQAAG